MLFRSYILNLLILLIKLFINSFFTYYIYKKILLLYIYKKYYYIIIYMNSLEETPLSFETNDTTEKLNIKKIIPIIIKVLPIILN